MKIGDPIRVCACKADGSVYRSWQTIIELVDVDKVVTISPAGNVMEDCVRGNIRMEHVLRSYYWLDKFYNLIELFDTQGKLVEIYINIASPPEFEDGTMSFIDHELDVLRYPPKAAQLIDEDEFAEAAVKYQYTQEFQDRMYSVAQEAIELANTWQVKSVPPYLITNS